jgi:murein DD-endopeptidase MepM/ murein hydrolase activator NlpD
MRSVRLVLCTLVLLAARSGASEQAWDLNETIRSSREQERDLLGEIDKFDRQLQALSDELDASRQKLDEVDAHRRQAEDDMAATSARLEALSGEVRTHCAVLYGLVRRGVARVLFDADSPSDLRRRIHYVLAVIDYDRGRLRIYNEELARRSATVARVAQDRAAVESTAADIQIKESNLRDERSKRMALLDSVRSRKDLALQASSERSVANEDFTAGLKPAVAAAEPGEPTSAAGSPGGEWTARFRASYGHLPSPVQGRMIRPFGTFVDPLTNQEAKNQGVDIEAPYGTPFRSVFDGVVAKAGFIRGYGQTVVVQHGAWSTVYAHANGLRVSVGQDVTQGQILGYVGNSGLVDTQGYLLHFEIRYNATPQDPGPWLGRGGARP